MIHKNKVYRNVTGTEINKSETTEWKGWSWLDRFVERTDTVTDLWWKIKTGEEPVTTGSSYQVKTGHPDNTGFLGMQKPWGAVLAIGMVGIIGFSIYKLSKK